MIVGLLAGVGLTLGVLCGVATQVQAGPAGKALAQVGWLAGILLVAGIGAGWCSRSPSRTVPSPQSAR